MCFLYKLCVKTRIISVVKFYGCLNFNLKMGTLVPTTRPRSSIRQVISIPYFCADTHFLGMRFDLSPAFTGEMMEIQPVMTKIILIIRFYGKDFCNL